MSEKTLKVKKIKQQYENEWLAIKGVTAVGIGKVDPDEIGIIISVNDKIHKFKNLIPDNIKGIPIIIQETGELKAF